MTKPEIQMNDECPNDERRIGHSDLVIHSDFWFRIWSFSHVTGASPESNSGALSAPHPAHHSQTRDYFLSNTIWPARSLHRSRPSAACRYWSVPKPRAAKSRDPRRAVVAAATAARGA